MGNIVDKLNKSPLFAMSKGSMELFHSNFWSWLINEIDNEYVLAFVKDRMIDFNNIKNTEREKKHTDILINYGKQAIVIENKIKSLPYKNQLKKYEESIDKKFYFGVCVYPYNFGDNIILENWSFITYDEILNGIERITIKNKQKLLDNVDINGKFCYDLICEYVDMTRNVIEIIKSQKENISNNIITSEDVKEIDQLGLADIVKKINARILFNFLRENLIERYPEERYCYACGFNHKKITISIRKIINTDENGYILLGPQLEEDNFRRTIHVTNKTLGINKNKKDRDLLYEKLKGIYFDIEEKNSKYNYPIVKKEAKLYNEYNGYYGEKDYNLLDQEYIAIYRYYKINSTSFEYILKLFEEELEYVSKIVDDRELINKINLNTVKKEQK
jgi:hypothetical protein